MGKRTYEIGAQVLVRMVRERPWVDNDGIPVHMQYERKRVGMAVRGDAQVAQRSGIEMHIDFAIRRTCLLENKVPALCKEPVGIGGRRRRQRK